MQNIYLLEKSEPLRRLNAPEGPLFFQENILFPIRIFISGIFYFCILFCVQNIHLLEKRQERAEKMREEAEKGALGGGKGAEYGIFI